MKLIIETAANGYVLRVPPESADEAERTWVIAEGDPVDNTRALLAEVLEEVGYVGGRHDARRVQVIIAPGDHYISPEEWQRELDAQASRG